MGFKFIFLIVVDLCCVSFSYTAKWLSYIQTHTYIFIYILFQILSHCWLLQDIEYSSLCYTVRLVTYLFYICVFAQLCLTFCDPVDCGPPGSSVHEIFQSRILEWVAISYSRGSSRPRDWTCISCIANSFFTTGPLGSPILYTVVCIC